jgi:hypothetical protein
VNEIGHAYDAEGTGEIRITLHTGKRIDLRKLDAADIHIEDIAHALSNVCRFNGHVPEFYSVAQHCVIVSALLPADLQFAGLLHDASEAYIGDVSHFLKHSDYMVGYRDFERVLEEKIARRFGLPYPNDPKVKQADRTACDIEWRQMMRGESISIVETIIPLKPALARQAFLREYRRLAVKAGLPAITRV